MNEKKKSCWNLSKWEKVEEMKKEIAVQWKWGQLRREVWEKQMAAMGIRQGTGHWLYQPSQWMERGCSSGLKRDCQVLRKNKMHLYVAKCTEGEERNYVQVKRRKIHWRGSNWMRHSGTNIEWSRIHVSMGAAEAEGEGRSIRWRGRPCFSSTHWFVWGRMSLQPCCGLKTMRAEDRAPIVKNAPSLCLQP